MCIMLYSKRDGEWIKRARGNSLGARTACEEFWHASHRCDEDSSGPLICLWADLHATVSIFIVKYPTGGSEPLTYTGWTKYLVNPATTMYNECTGMSEIEKVMRSLQGT